MRLSCGETNCWDVIDILPIHSYAYTAHDVIGKLLAWEAVWAEDLIGANGRSKKTLWLTEFSRVGAVDSSDPDGKTRAFMHDVMEYMTASPYVSGWSWFSEVNMSSFVLGDREPETATWATDLIDKEGKATVIGSYYAELCKGK